MSNDLCIEVGVAGVIHPLGPAAAYRPVQRPIGVKLVSVDPPTLTAHFPVRGTAEQLPRVFDDVLVLGDVLLGVYAPTVDGGGADPQAVPRVVVVDLGLHK